MTTNVPVGLSTIVGYLSAAAAAIAPIIGQLADDLTPLGVPSETWVYVSAILAAITTIGRMYQAGKAAALPAILRDPLIGGTPLPTGADEETI